EFLHEGVSLRVGRGRRADGATRGVEKASPAFHGASERGKVTARTRPDRVRTPQRLAMTWDDDEPNPLPSIDLHRMNAVDATRALARELHAARVRGATAVIAITGRGFGNRLQEP